MLFVATTVALSSCKETNEPAEPQPPQQPQNNPALVNTSWASNIQSDYTYSGVAMHLDLQSTLDFTDLTNGEFFMDITVTVPAMPNYSQSNNETFEFTYTFDGTQLVITGRYTDPETGETMTYDYNAVYDPNAETITLDMDDEEMVEMMGTDILVFTRIR